MSSCKELSDGILSQGDHIPEPEKGRDYKIERYDLKHFLTFVMALLLQLAEVA